MTPSALSGTDIERYHCDHHTHVLGTGAHLSGYLVHGLSAFFKKLGIFTYITPVITWAPFCWLIYINREFLLRYQVSFPLAARSAGWIVLALGMLLQLWTLKAAQGWGLIGLARGYHVRQRKNYPRQGRSRWIRHPTYLSHTIMYAGVFLITGFFVVGS